MTGKRNDLQCGIDSNRLPPWGDWDNTMIRHGGLLFAQRLGRVLRGRPGEVVILDDIDRDNWFYNRVKPR